MAAEHAYATAMHLLEQQSPACVDHFYRAAAYCWAEMELQVQQSSQCDSRTASLYCSSLQSIVEQGTVFRRLDSRQGLNLCIRDRWRWVPIHSIGFVRDPNSFASISTVGDYSTDKLNHLYRFEGIGIPSLISGVRPHGVSFQRRNTIFASTLLLRRPFGQQPPTSDIHAKVEDGNRTEAFRSDAIEPDVDDSFTLELVDPLRVTTISCADAMVPVHRDISAPLAKALETTDRNYLQEFLQPGVTSPDEQGLFTLEPYRPGKIPVIFVHGLLSDRLTWANMVNEIAGRPEFLSRFQPWNFEYPTGEPFLKSAANLRHQLREIVEHVDPEGHDPALRQIVLIGHSMGGLISDAQISSSADRLWCSISNQPFEQTIVQEEYRDRLQEAFFFEPSPNVTRVVFIGAPHRGSGMANRFIGRLAASLVKEPAEVKEAHRQLIGNNPGVFSSEFSRRIPTSIDLLDPNSNLLQTLTDLPKSNQTVYHSIIGNSHWSLTEGKSDGVVPVDSAYLPGAATNKYVATKHSKLPQDPEVIEEVLAILDLHYRTACVELESPTD
jgi:pimeloyl-ACP methyl ester carboxylesterase